MSSDDQGAAGPSPTADAAAAGASEEDGSSQPSLLARLLGLASDKPEAEASPAQAPSPGPGVGEREMLVNIRRLHEMRVLDVMIPRADVDAVEIATDLDALVDVFRDTQHTRLPVYRETLDDPAGFVHLKDVALGFGFGAGAGEDGFRLESLLRPMLYVPPSMRIEALLQKMQAARVHMALVIDEYGGVDGLVTIEDLLEQIVGEIEDEHDVADAAPFRAEAEGVYNASARAELPEFEEAAGVDLLPDDLDEDVDTLGGLVFMLAGRIPERGEVIPHPDGHEFEVLDADPRRIKRLRARLQHAESEPEARAAE